MAKIGKNSPTGFISYVVMLPLPHSL